MLYPLCAGILLLLYAIPAATLGLWEPWETNLAALAASIADTDGASIFAPIVGGELLSHGWLDMAAISVALKMGGGELALRMPAVLFGVLTGIFVLYAFDRVYSRGRAFAVAILMGIAPATFLGAVSLAGDALLVGPTTVACAAIASAAARPADSGPLRALLWGSLITCFLAGGLYGLAIPLYTLAFVAFADRDPDARPGRGWKIAGFALLAVTALLSIVLPAAWGWERALSLVISHALFDLPLALCLIAVPASPLRHLFAKRATLIGLAVFAAVAAVPLISLFGAVELEAAFHFLVARDPFSALQADPHISFDNFIRVVGFGVYPTVVLLPFAMGYFVRAMREHHTSPDRRFKQAMIIFLGVGFVVVGLASNLVGHRTFPVVLPVVAAVALALTDREFLRFLGERRTLLYLSCITSLLLLAVFSKDVRGNFDEDAGRPGPKVIFEFLLADGSFEFPPDYVFRGMSLFFLVWALVIITMLAEPLKSQVRTAEALQGSDNVFGRLVGRVASFFTGLARWLSNAIGERVDTPGTKTIAFGVFVASVFAWTATLGAVWMPELTYHVSNKSLIDTYEEYAEDGEPLYLAALGGGHDSYYLSDEYETLGSVSDLRAHWCNGERIFAVIPTDRLGEAWNTIRRADDSNRNNRRRAANRQEDDEADAPEEEAQGCDGEQRVYVPWGRSSRYTLISNELHTDDGETEQNIIADNVFTLETIPETARRIERRITMDNKLRLVATEISPAEVSSGEVTISTYWEVLSRVTGTWEMFVHVDIDGNRINGDHDPVGGHFAMRHWVPGEIVRDQYTLKVSRLGDRAGDYTVWVGFFRGDDRMRVRPADSDNRVNVGTLTVKR